MDLVLDGSRATSSYSSFYNRVYGGGSCHLMVKTLLLFFHISLQMPIPFDHTTNIQKDPKVT